VTLGGYPAATATPLASWGRPGEL